VGWSVTDKLIEINLHGACHVRSTEPEGFVVSGAKHKALFALLATAPFGRRTRSFLQETLWGVACYDTGRQSLRRALADIKQIMGDAYGRLLSSTNADVTLDLARVAFIGQPGSAPILEGLDIKEKGFVTWLAGLRENPGQIDALFQLAARPLERSMLPLIAVLPFRAPGGQPEDVVIGDWLAEETCRSLSRSRMLSVISHLSCRELAERPMDIVAVRTTLRTDFCIQGTIRRIGANIIVDADLVDVRNAQIVWTRNFEAPAASFLEHAAEGIGYLVRAAGSAIADDAIQHVSSRELSAVEDHRLLIAGVKLMYRPALRDFARARELIEEALRRAPQTAEAHAWLGKWHVLSVFNGWSTDVAVDKQLALDCTARGLDLSPDNSFCLTIDGFAHTNLWRRLDIGERRYDLALESNPNEAFTWLLRGALHTFRSEGQAAVAAAEKARRLSPIDPFGYYYDAHTAGAYLCLGDYETAYRLSDRAHQANDRHLSTMRIRLSALHFLGRSDEVEAAGQELMRRQPTFTVAGYMRDHPAADFEVGRKMETALLAAGVPKGE
jgi:TolB-like protein/tetratricopeptide (TPR) repeat protein